MYLLFVYTITINKKQSLQQLLLVTHFDEAMSAPGLSGGT